MPERIETDVLIVGAGPGGIGGGYHLARHGIDVLAVDKATFPREKVCGDGLTPRSVAAILNGWASIPSDPGFERVIGLRVYSRNVTIELPWPELHAWPDYGLVMPRHDFDALLLERAQKAGARVLEARRRVEPLIRDGWVAGAERPPADEKPTTEPTEIRRPVRDRGRRRRRAASPARGRPPRRLAGRSASPPAATTARRPLRALARVLARPLGGRHAPARLRVALPAGRRLDQPRRRAPQHVQGLQGHLARSGCSTRSRRCFPTIGGSPRRHAEGRHALGTAPDGLQPRAAGGARACSLIGDAAGAVNPFNGEGIAYAIETGEMAAELLHEALVQDRPGDRADVPAACCGSATARTSAWGAGSRS